MTLSTPLLVAVAIVGTTAIASANADEVPPGDGAALAAPEAKRVDLNTATVTELDGLPGVGRKRAEAIIAEREKRPFRRPTELLRIKGFGPKLFARLRPFVTVGDPKRAGAP